ncbi:metallophosphoesterase [Homoserinimonas hongtaonis]|uniref:Uncharacterized protein n=1 Tax=Homoserinimonas hongtaonis TaxID=2079791 RepID=A0A2U1T2S4_9MICO|nr:metallophosphoesterase [Salinibacterium hongtaonis]PWB98184.1 hypothetical protein DF220_10350 [Salinibacterium hongtaonis]
MADLPPSADLSSARFIGILGDTHGDLGHLLIVAETMWKRGVSVLLTLGDFGFVWRSKNWTRTLDRISDRLRKREQVLYFVDGNHEDFAALYGFDIADDGLRRVRHNIVHIPRGYRTRLNSRETLAALGGANSIDRNHRREGHSWWPEESITDEDLEALGHVRADVLVGHDAPLFVPALDAVLAENRPLWRQDMLTYAEAGRRQFHRGFLQVRPSLYLGGHYHVDIDETVRYGDGEESFETRVMILSDGGAGELGQGILNVHTRDVRLFRRNDATVTELIGMEDGQWRVETTECSYVFDLEKGTVTGSRDDEAASNFIDRVRRLGDIEACRVGEPGAWTVRGGGYLHPVERLQRSSEVRSIERISEGESR